jgi:hypothetical protein
MELYPWRFDSIHPHCHDDVNSILNILKNFGLSRTSATCSEKTGSSGTCLTMKEEEYTMLESTYSEGQFNDEDCLINRIPAIVPLATLYFGLYYLEGHIFLKNWTYRVLLRHNTSPFKGACRFIYLK